MNRAILRAGIRCLIYIFAAMFIMSLAVPAYSAEAGKAIATLTSYSGTVLIKSKGEWGVQPQEGLSLYSDDKIVTRMGIATVTFDDGAVIEIKANSNLLIRDTEETGVGREIGAVKRQLRLLVGKMLFRTGRRTSTSTTLETTTMVCGLRGTAGTLSIDAAGVTYIQFTEGGGDTIGNFISGIAPDVPPEIAELNPAQRAAIVAAAAAEQAKKVAEQLAKGEITDKEAALAAAEAAKAAAEEAKAAAEAMLNSPDENIRQEALAVIALAEEAIETADEVIDAFLNGGDDDAVLGSSYGVLGDYLTRLVYNPAIQGNESDILLSGDLVPPVFDVTTFPADFNNLSSPVFSFNVDEYVTYYYILDGGDRVRVDDSEAGEATFELSGLTEGSHTLELILIDGYGNEASQDFSWITDLTAPVVALSVLPGTTARLIASPANSEPGNVSYLFINASTGQVMSPESLADGSYSINVTATDQAGNTSTSTTPFTFVLDNVSLAGDVLGSGSVITGSATGVASMVYGIDHGGWETDLVGAWSGTHGDSLSLTSGGSQEEGYWLSLTSGAIDGTGAATGTTNLYFIYESSVSRGTGNFNGTFSTDSTWSGTDAGYNLVTTPFEMSGNWVSDAFYYYGLEMTSTGSNGYAGMIATDGTDYDLFAMGDYTTNPYTYSYTGPYLWLAEIGSYDDVTPNLYENHALMGGVWNNGSMNGFLAGLYDEDEGPVGILYSEISGDYYSLNAYGDYGIWKVEGTLTPVEMTDIGTAYYIPDAAPYQSNFLFDDVVSYDGIYVDTSTYETTENGESLVNYIFTEASDDFYMALGAWAARLDGNYGGASAPGNGWSMSVEGTEVDAGPQTYLIEIGPGSENGTTVVDSTWASNNISAYAAGAWIDLDNAVTGVLGGKLAGTFDADYSTWQSIAMGSLMDTKVFLEMADTVDGRARLAQLDIPCVEVGNTTLYGSDAAMSVTISDVKFFAYSTGADPKLWATGDVSGTFNYTPSAAVPIASTSGSSISGNFTVTSWSSNTWSAEINGVGELSRTDIADPGAEPIEIEGGAAGNYTVTDNPATGAGEFSGTASGVTREYVP